jgi:hypothetical protein
LQAAITLGEELVAIKFAAEVPRIGDAPPLLAIVTDAVRDNPDGLVGLVDVVSMKVVSWISFAEKRCVPCSFLRDLVRKPRFGVGCFGMSCVSFIVGGMSYNRSTVSAVAERSTFWAGNLQSCLTCLKLGHHSP